MLTTQGARQELAAQAAEIVRFWDGENTSFLRRLLDAAELDVSEIAWEELRDDDECDDASLRGAWWYVYCFLNAAREGVEDLDGVPWPKAVAVMEEIAQRLAEGRPVDEALLLRDRLQG